MKKKTMRLTVDRGSDCWRGNCFVSAEELSPDLAVMPATMLLSELRVEHPVTSLSLEFRFAYLGFWKFEQSPLIKDLITTIGSHWKTRKRKKKKTTKTNFSELLSDDLFSQGLVGGCIWQPAEVMQFKALLHWLCWAHWQTWLHSKFKSYI